tara:strand:+ start:93 stop:305 length:213 start_codon:yes stop_codon:yes gene_type:complete
MPKRFSIDLDDELAARFEAYLKTQPPIFGIQAWAFKQALTEFLDRAGIRKKKKARRVTTYDPDERMDGEV